MLPIVVFITLWRSDGVTGMFLCLLYSVRVCFGAYLLLSWWYRWPGGLHWILDKEIETTPLAPFSIALHSIEKEVIFIFAFYIN